MYTGIRLSATGCSVRATWMEDLTPVKVIPEDHWSALPIWVKSNEKQICIFKHNVYITS